MQPNLRTPKGRRMSRQRVVVDSLARLIDPEVRAELGIKTAEESVAAAVRKSEKAEHKIFSDWCRLNDVPCRTDRMDRRVTGSVGWPDFLVVYGGRVLPLEFKIYGNKLSEDQKEVHAQLARTGTDVVIAYSADEGIRRVRSWLWEFFRWTPRNET